MRRPLVLACSIPLVLLLAGCLPETEATPAPTSATPGSSPSAIPGVGTAPPSPTPTSPAPSPSAAAPTTDPFPVDALADVCVTGALESGAAAARIDLSQARREDRGQDTWAVAVPGVTDDGADVIYLCTLSGTPEEFQLELRTRVEGILDDTWTTRLADVEAGRG